jgi:hypothetical protein
MIIHTVSEKKTAGMIIIPIYIKKLPDMYAIQYTKETFFTFVVIAEKVNDISRETGKSDLAKKACQK